MLRYQMRQLQCLHIDLVIHLHHRKENERPGISYQGSLKCHRDIDCIRNLLCQEHLMSIQSHECEPHQSLFRLVM